MSKITFTSLLFIFIFILQSSTAQTNVTGPVEKKFYFHIDVGYGFGVGSKLGINYLPSNLGNPAIRNVYGSYGNGLKGGIGLGYFFNPYIGLELTASINSLNAPMIEISSLDKLYTSGYQVCISPMVVIKAPLGRLAPYLKLGATIPAYSSKLRTYEGSSNNKESTVLIENQIINAVSMGIVGGVGSYFYISKQISLFSEFSFSLLSQNTLKSTTTSIKINGKEEIDNMLPLDRRERNFSDTEIDTSGNTLNLDGTNPRGTNFSAATLSEVVPMSNVGVKFGIIFNLGKD